MSQFPDYVAELEKPVLGLKLGVAKEYLGEGLDKEVRSAIEAAIQKLAKQGCEIVEISLPIPSTRFRLITLWPRRRLLPTWPFLTACVTDIAPRNARTLSEMYRRSRDHGFWRRSEASDHARHVMR